MMYNYIIENYTNGEPIFLKELPGESRDYLRQEMKKLVDEGRLERLYNGVYYLSYITILGTKGRIAIDKYIEKKFLTVDGKAAGYITGLQLANKYGFTTQNPSCYEICSNEATTKQRKQEIDGNTIVVYKPVTDITETNRAALQFLDLMSVIDKYSEVTGEELARINGGRSMYRKPELTAQADAKDTAATDPSPAKEQAEKMKDPVAVAFEEAANRSAAYKEGELIGVCEFSVSEQIWIIDHTGVRPAYGGQGIARRLVEKVIEEARARQIKILPLCSYASKMMEGKTEYQDVLVIR